MPERVHSVTVDHGLATSTSEVHLKAGANMRIFASKKAAYAAALLMMLGGAYYAGYHSSFRGTIHRRQLTEDICLSVEDGVSAHNVDQICNTDRVPHCVKKFLKLTAKIKN